MTRQLVFDLPPNATLTREDFFTSDANQAALGAIDCWQEWPDGKMVLVGPEGAGKTHLAHIWAEAAQAVVVGPMAIATADLPLLASGRAVVVEDADRIAGNRAAETALFHLHNLLVPHGRLLITATTPPRDWGLVLADLQSRLQAAPLTRLAPPDDTLLSAVLVKLFADRQISVAPSLIAYLITRMDRSIGAARQLVARLDTHALALGRPVTRALAAEVLDSPGQG